MALFTDDFTGPDGQIITARAGWTTIISSAESQRPQINGFNQLKTPADAEFAGIVGQDKGEPDHYVQFTALSQFPYGTASRRNYVCIRVLDSSEFYAVAYSNIDNLWELWKAPSNRIGTYSAAFLSGTVVRLEAEGSTIRVKLDGVTRISVTDTALPTQTIVGLQLRAGGNNPTIDNWESDTIGGAVAPTLTSPTASATSPTTSTGSVSTDQADGTLYWLTNTSNTATATAVKAGSSQSVTASGAQATASSGLTENTTYYTHFLHRNAGGLDSAVVTSASFTTPTNIFASDDYNDILADQLLTGRTLNNALGGTGTRTYTAGGSLSLYANSIPKVTGPTDDSWNSVAVGQQDFRATYTFDPILSTSAIQLTGRKGAASGNTTYYGVRLDQGHTTLSIYEGTGSDARPPNAFLATSTTLTKPGVPIKLQADFEGTLVTARVLRASDGAQLAEVSYDFFESALTGNFLSFGFAGGGQTGYFDNLILESLTDVTPEPPDMNGSITVGTKTSGSISISYPAASDPVGVTGYEVSSNGTTWLDNGLTLSYTFLGLAELTPYTVYVRAYNAAGLRADPALSVTTSTYRAGDTGANIVANTGPIGGNPAGILYNDVNLPADAAKWFSYRVTTPPADPSKITLNPDGSFIFTGTVADSFYYQLEVDGEDVGVPQLVTLTPESAGTAPILTSATAASTGATTSSGTVTTDQDNGTLYWVTTVNATESAATVKAGSSQAVTATGVQNTTSSGLTGATTYYTHYLHRNSGGQDSAVLTSNSFTTDNPPDVTAPTLTSPTATASGPNTAGGTVTTNEGNGTLYYLFSQNAVESAPAVKAAASQSVTATGVQSVSVVGLTSLTTYYAHYLHRDAAGNDSNVVTSASFTTLAPDVEPDTGVTRYMPFPIKAGRVQLSTAAVAATDVFFSRLRFTSSGSAVRAVAAGPVVFASGLALSASGQVCYVDATSSLPAGTTWSGGLPYSAGRLCVSTGDIAYHQNGVPFTSTGAVAVEINV